MERYLLVNGRLAAPDSDYRTRIERAAPPLTPVFSPGDGWIDEYLSRIEVVFGGFPGKYIQSATALRWVQTQGAGAEGVIREYASRPDLRITNASGVHAIPIAEHLLAMMFVFARRLHDFLRLQKSHIWSRDAADALTEITGKRLLIVGYGAIGRELAKKAHAFGMSVTGVRKFPGSMPTDNGNLHAGVDILGPADLMRVLPEADYIANILPHTGETTRLFGKAEFEAMKSTTVFLNAGRGRTVDEEALIDALRNGSIAGAGLDVFETEPLPQDSPLWDMEHVIVTPHIAGLTPVYDSRLLDIFVANLERYHRGEELLNIVDRSLGY